MEKLQQLLNLTNKDGEVITVFNGKLTLSQLIVILIALAVVIFAFKVLKGVIKTVVTIAAICICLVHYGIASPTQIKDVASTITENGVSTYKKIANASDNIKLKDTSIKIKVGKKWIDVSDIDSFIESKEGVVTVTTKDGEKYKTDDSDIISLLKTFK